MTKPFAPLIDGLFPAATVESAKRKETAILSDLHLDDYLALDVGVYSDYIASQKLEPLYNPKSRMRNEKLGAYKRRLKDYRKRHAGMRRAWEAARARYDAERWLFDSHIALVSSLDHAMDDQELLYGFLVTANPMLSQAYTHVIERRKLINRHIGDILGLPWRAAA